MTVEEQDVELADMDTLESSWPGPIAIILAAGHGKRMKSDLAKVLHPVCGRPMIHHVLTAVRGAGVRRIVVVVGHGADQVQNALADQHDVQFVLQEQQLGTGHAVNVCAPLLQGYAGPALVLVGDEPLLRPEALVNLLAKQASSQAACLLGTAFVPSPAGFGRIVRDASGHFQAIVEQRDCTPEQLTLCEVNPSCYVFELPLLWEALARLDRNNAQGEFYLTDAPAWLLRMGHTVLAIPELEAEDVLGINDRIQLAEAHVILQRRIQNRWLAQGVGIVDPRNTYVDVQAEIGRDTIIYPFSVLTGKVVVGNHCKIGPFAHLRDGTVIADRAEVGAFVETNRSEIGAGTVARHLAYLGDAQIGPDVNIGAGVITANFDGVSKHATTIAAKASIGAGAVLIAPVTIGAQATVGAGAVVTKLSHVPAETTVVGVPAKVHNPSPKAP